MSRRATQPVPSRTRFAFTLLEVLVSVALLAITVAAVSSIFTISSDSAARAAANADVMRASSALRDRLSDQLAKVAHEGLFIIDSPNPTTPRAETLVNKFQRGYRLRHDRLVSLNIGDVHEYVSHTDPFKGDPLNPTARPATSAEAIVYFGPGTPLTGGRLTPAVPRPLANDANPLGFSLTAQEWFFIHRATLLLNERDPNNPTPWNPPNMTMLASGNAFTMPAALVVPYSFYWLGQMDAIVSAPPALPASVQTISRLIANNPLTDFHGTAPNIAGLWEPSFAPSTVSTLNPNDRDFYTRGGANFIAGMADFRIEWTDGKQVNPNDPDGPDDLLGTWDDGIELRWFGLRPDPDFDVSDAVLDDLSSPGAGTPPLIPYIAITKQAYLAANPAAATPDELLAFGVAPGSQNQIEWTSHSGADESAAYRAFWRADTWQHRPKALRFTYRIYDAGNRLKHSTTVDLDQDGDFDPDDGGPANDDERRVGIRYGREFSIVVPMR